MTAVSAWGDPELFAALPMPPVRWLRIAGTAGWRGKRSPFRTYVNDGVVALDEATQDGNLDAAQVGAWHTFLMNNSQAWRAIDRLLAEPGATCSADQWD